MTKNEIVARWLDISKNVMNPDYWIVPYELTKGDALMYQTHQLEFDKSYDWLMPAWVKFRDLKFDYVRKKNDYLMHDKHRTLIANTITHGTIKEAFDELVKGIEWYNNLNSKL